MFCKSANFVDLVVIMRTLLCLQINLFLEEYNDIPASYTAGLEQFVHVHSNATYDKNK